MTRSSDRNFKVYTRGIQTHSSRGSVVMDSQYLDGYQIVYEKIETLRIRSMGNMGDNNSDFSGRNKTSNCRMMCFVSLMIINNIHHIN